MPVVSLRRGRPERRERGLQVRLAAEELPEHLHRRPARPGGEAAERAERVGRVRRPGEEAREHLLDLRPRPGGDEVRALRDGMRAEGEPRDDPEVAAAATAAGPVEVAVVRLVGDEDLPVGGDDLDGDEVVGGEPPGA